MVYSIRNNQGSDEPPKRLPPIHNPPTKALPDFFTTSTTKIFQILGLDDSFLDRDPQQWESEQSYSEAKDIISALRVTNELAEKRVALMQSFNEALVRNEEVKQFCSANGRVPSKQIPKSNQGNK